MKAFNIKWDTDGVSPKELDLPEAVEIPAAIASTNDDDTISDWLSDEYGFCHFGFSLTMDSTTANPPKHRVNNTITSPYDYWMENIMDERLTDSSHRADEFEKWQGAILRCTGLDTMPFERITDNQENIDHNEGGYHKGYAEGYHDAFVELLNYLGIEHSEDYYN